MKVKYLNFIFVFTVSMLMLAGTADARVYEYFDSQGNKYREMERAVPGYAGHRFTILRDTYFDTVTGDKKNETRYEYNDNGKRTHINSFTYKRDDSGVLQEIRQNEQEYDPETGSRIRLTYFDSSTNTKYYELRYRTDNQQLSYTRFDTATGDKTSETRYVYSDEGKKIQMNSFIYKKDSSGILQEILQSETEYYPDTGYQKRRTQYNTDTNKKSYEYIYDSDNRVSEYIRYDSAGNMNYKDERSYDSDGKLIEIKEYGLNEDGDFVNNKKTTYEYHGNGKIKRVVQTKIVGTSERVISEVDYYDNGRTEFQAYYNQDTGAKIYEYTYDSDGRQTVYQRFASDGETVTQRNETQYNGDGKIMQQIQSVHEAGSLRVKNITAYEYQADPKYYSKIETFTFNYDEDGNQVGDRVQTALTTYHENSYQRKEVMYFNAETGNKTYQYTYNENGQTIMYEYYARDGVTVQSRTTYAYNEAGRTTEVVSYSIDSTSNELIPTGKTSYVYREDGKYESVSYYRYNSGNESLEVYSQTIYSYHENGRYEFIRSYGRNSSGQLALTSETEYYDTGRTKKSVSYNASNGVKTYEAEYHENGRTKRTTYFNGTTGNKTSENYYDENGRYTGSAGFNSDGVMISQTTYTYNANNQYEEIVTSTLVGEELVPTQKTMYTYHPNNQRKSIISVKILSNGDEQPLSKVEYSHEGRTVLQEGYNSSTGIISYRYTYTNTGQALAYITYDADGNERYSTNYVYDEQNRVTDVIVKNVVDGVYRETQKTVYAYYPNDKYYEIKTFSVKADGSETLTSHNEYFDTGTTKMRTYFNSTTGNKTYKYEYNYNGSTQYYERYADDGLTVVSRYDYSYDDLNRLSKITEKGIVGDNLTDVYVTDYTYHSNDRTKSIKRYKLVSGQDPMLVQMTEYHSTGRTKEQVSYNDTTGKITYRYTYDENGRQLMYQRFGTDGVTVIDQREYTYHSGGVLDGKLKDEVRSVYEAGQLRTKYVTNYTYQSDGKYSKIESFTYNYNESGDQVGDPIRTGLTTYHEGSNQVKERVYYDAATGNKTYMYVYNSDGRTERYERYAKDGETVTAKTMYSYNGDGQTTEVINYTLDLESNELLPSSKTTYSYHSNNRTQFIRSYSFKDGLGTLTSETEYYDTGRTKRSTSFNATTGNKTYEYYYDSDGRYQGNAYFDSNGNVTSKTEYHYDSNNRTESINSFSIVDGQLTLTQKTRYTYHSNGRNQSIVSVKVLADGNEQFLSKLEYNSDGRITLQEYYNNTTGIISYRYTYDLESGKQTGYTRYDSDGNENYKITYTYDTGGRLTEQEIKSIDGGIYRVTQRTVYTYFPNDKYYEIKTFSVKSDGSEILTNHSEYFDTGTTKMRTYFNSTTGNKTYKYEYNYNGSTQYYERYETDGVTVNYRADYVYDDLNRLTRLNEKTLTGNILTLSYFTDRTYFSNDRVKDILRYKVLSDGVPMLVSMIEYYSTGNIKEQTVYHDSNGKLQYRYLYNESGRVTSYERFDINGSVVAKQEYAYDSNNRNIQTTYFTLVEGLLTATSQTRTEYNSDGRTVMQSNYSLVGEELKLTTWTVYTYDGNYYSTIDSFKQNYDENGNATGDPIKTYSATYHPNSYQVKERTSYRNDGTKSSQQSYSVSGQLLKTESFDSTGNNVISKVEYEYDSEGREISRTTHSIVNDLLVPVSQTNSVYNSEGKRILSEEYKRIGNRLRKTNWTVYEYSGSYYSKIESFLQNYDENGNPIGDPITTGLTTYHPNSNSVKERVYFTNQGIRTYRYAYNTSGRNTLYEKYDSSGQNVIVRTEYDYDDRDRTTRVTNSSLVDGVLKVTSWSTNTYEGDYQTVAESFVQNYDADGNAMQPIKTYQALYYPNSNVIQEKSDFNSTNGIITRKREYRTDDLLDTDTRYDAEGNPSSQMKHHYDQNKKLIRIEDFIFNEQGAKVKIGETRYEYASNGRYSKVATFRMMDGELIMTASTDYEYDSHNRYTKITQSSIVDGEFRATNETTYDYDQNGRLERQQNFKFIKDSAGNLLRKLESEYLYDSLTGRLARYRIYDVVTGLLKAEYTYNSNGRLLANITFDGNGNRLTEVYNTYVGSQLTKVESYRYYDGPNDSRIKKKTGEQIYNADTGNLEKDSVFTYDFDVEKRIEKETSQTINYDEAGNQSSKSQGEIHYLYEGTVDGESVNTYYVSANYDEDNKLTAKSVTIKGPENELILRIEHTIEDGEITGTKVFNEDDEEITDPDRGMGSDSNEMNAGDIMQVYWTMMTQRPGSGPATMPGGGGVAAGSGPAGLQFIGGANLPGANGFGGQFSVQRPSAFNSTGSFGE